jgi:thioredoxin reductase (NADPH)
MDQGSVHASPAAEPIYDCIVIGAGPGGLQAAIYLGRFNRRVLLLDRGGGRTAHAKAIENFLTQPSITGKRMIELGLEQARSFKVGIETGMVTSVTKQENFEVAAGSKRFLSRFVVAGTGIYDIIPPLGNLAPFFGTSFFTCIDCDGYKTIGKKLVVMGDTIETVRLAFAMRELYTGDVSLVLSGPEPPEDYREELRNRGIALYLGVPGRIVGMAGMEAVELKDGRQVAANAVMANFGFKLNDSYLKDVQLKRSSNGSIVVNGNYESSLNGLYVVGPLNTGHDQAVIAAGQGAVAAIDINKRLFEF